MTNDNAFIIDNTRTACLCDVGGGDYLLATAVAPDGTTALVLAHQPDIGNPDAGLDPSCPEAVFDQAGPLPRELLDDISDAVAHYLSSKQPRCGRPTKTTGRPCRIEVTRRGEPCGLHRRQAALDLLADQLGAKPIDSEGDNP